MMEEVCEYLRRGANMEIREDEVLVARIICRH